MKKDKKSVEQRKLEKEELEITKKLLTRFIGEGNEIFFVRNFSFAGFVFGSLYLLFRKLYFIGLPLLFLNVALCINLDHYIGYIILFITHLVIGFTVNKLYAKYSLKTVNKIREKNDGLTEEQIITVCRDKGGITISAILLSIILVIGMVFSIKPLEKYVRNNVLKEEIDDKKPNDDKNTTEDNKPVEDVNKTPEGNIENPVAPNVGVGNMNEPYDGTLTYDTTIKINNDFDVTIPTNFTPGIFNDEAAIDYTLKSTNDENVLNTCSLSFQKVLGYNDPAILINGIKEYNKTVNPVTKATINSINWDIVSLDTNDELTKKEVYYATQKNGSVYLLEYETGKDADSSICDSNFNTIINSIKLK